MVLFKFSWWWYYFILLFVPSPHTWIWSWSIIDDLLILLQHAKCIASFIGIGSYVLTYGHDCTGTHHGMQLHTLLVCRQETYALHSYAFMRSMLSKGFYPRYYEALYCWLCSKSKVCYFNSISCQLEIPY